MRLAGKKAVITGAAGNIGYAVAERFLADGAEVLLVDRDEAALHEAIESLPSGNATACVADVTSSASVEAYAMQAAALFGKVDIFFNNAGIEGPTARIEDFPEEGFDRVMAVNVKGVFLGMKHVSPVMKDGGSIIITSSIAGLMGSGGFVAYTASKHAVVGIMRDTAVDLAPRRIRVNTVHPGFVESEMMLRIMRELKPGVADADLVAGFAARTKLGRFVKPAEVAAMVAFLGSDDSQMATGQTYVVDAGTLL
jgi:NAD(P)-dependent dehydrogenase (short-subunit alcohol dehydrogenase family)